MLNFDWRKRRAASVLVPLTVLSLLGAVPYGINSFAAGGTAKPPVGAIAPYVIPTLPDPVTSVNTALINGFDDTGFIQSATVDTTNANCPNTTDPHRFGGTLVLNHGPIVVPCNMVIQMPANTYTWADFINGGPDLSLGKGYPSFEVHAIGNLVGPRRIAGLMFASQLGLNSGTGVITGIDYATGNLQVDNGNGAAPSIVQINDPNGRFGRAQSPDPRFSVDDANPTIHGGTGYPMCVPRTDPAVTDDSLCPQANRPNLVDVTVNGAVVPPVAGGCRNFSVSGIAPPVSGELTPPAAGQAYCSAFVMNSVAARSATDPDPRAQAPFEVGDSIIYSGTLFPAVGTAPAYISAHTVEANIGIFTMPGTQPSYLAIGQFGVGTADPSLISINGFAVETQDRLFLESETTDVKTAVDIYMTDVNPLTGAVRNRWVTPFEMTGEQNGPLQADGVTPIGGGITTQNVGPQPQRIRLRASRAPFGMLSAPSRNIRVAVRSLCTPQAPVNDAAGNALLTSLDTCLNDAAKTANGLMAGEYTAPTFDFIFPENVKPGDTLVPFDFWHLPFLRYGDGASTASGVGPLEPTPWSGASATVPGAPVIGAATATASTATAAWAPPVTDGGAAITSYTVTMLDSAGNPAGTPQTVAGNVTTATFTGLTAGASFSFKVSATNLLGTGPSSAVSNVVTLTAPATTTAPVMSLTVPSGPVSTTAVPASLTWTGTNATGYELQQSVNGAAFADIAVCTAATPCASTSTTVSVKPSPTNGTITTYRYQVRATNPAGTFGAYTAGTAFSVPALDNTGGFSFNGGWGGVNVAGAYNGSVHESSTAGAAANNSNVLSGSTVAWVSTTGPDRGMATVSVDGGAAVTVDLYSATLKPATLVWQATNLGTATGHTIKVTVLSTRNAASTGNKVDIDAYLGLK